MKTEAAIYMNEIRNILIGFQLGKKRSQICYYDRKAQEPVSISTKVGSTLYEFPTSLCKKVGRNEWHFGLEAEYFGKMSGTTFIDQLYEISQKEEAVIIEGKTFEPWELLHIFIEGALKMLGVQDISKSITGLVVTCESLEQPLVGHLKRALDKLNLRNGCIRIIDFDESFYYHTMYQKPELYSKKVALIRFDGLHVAFRNLQITQKTRPALVKISEEKEYPLEGVQEAWDSAFYQAITDYMGNDAYSSVFMIGTGFEQEWATCSLPLLAKYARRIYYGNNLFAKGACYAAKEFTEEKKLKDFLYYGKDLVGSNVGMEMIVHGMKVYYPLVVAGVNWYDIDKECEFILDDKEDLNFVVSPMEGGERKTYVMVLPNLPKRPNRTTRLRMHINGISSKLCQIKVTDLGFGEFYPASGKEWLESMKL